MPPPLPNQLASAAALALATEYDGRWDVPAPVAEQLGRWPDLGLPGLDALASEPAPTALAPVSSVDSAFTDHVASEHAFHTTSSIAELLTEPRPRVGPRVGPRRHRAARQ